MRKRQKTEAGRRRPPGSSKRARRGRAYRASCGSGPGRPMASSSHGLSALRQETPARKTASASFPPPAPDSSRGTRLRAAPGTLPLPPLWAPWPVTVWAGGRPGGDDGPSPCRPARRYVKRNRPRAARAAAEGGSGAGPRRATPRLPPAASEGWGLSRPRPPRSVSLPPPPSPQVASRPLKGRESLRGRSVLGPASLARPPQRGGAPGRGGAGPGARRGGAARPSGPRGGAPLRTPPAGSYLRSPGRV